MGDLSRNFSRREFACTDGCGFDIVSPALVDLLQEIRDELKAEVMIESGCRCEARNKEVGGVKDSGHLSGEAADIHTAGMDSRALGEFVRHMHRRGKLRDLTYCYRAGKRTVHVGVDRKKRRAIFGF